MAVGFQTSNNRDFDDIFEPRLTAKRDDVGFILSNGNDISNRYEKASSGTPASNVGYKLANGQDIGPLFAAKDGVSFWDGSVSDATDVSSFNGSFKYNEAEIIFYSNGQIERRTEDTSLVIGNWDGSLANSSNTEIFFDIVSQETIGSNVSNNASSFVPLNSIRSVSIASSDTEGLRNWIDVNIRLRKINDSSTEVNETVKLSVTVGTPLT